MVLSTCNRIEVYAAAAGPAEQVTRAAASVLAAHGRIPPEDVLHTARVHLGAAAAEHLFSVACGLDSMAVGEEQIVAQVNAAAGPPLRCMSAFPTAASRLGLCTSVALMAASFQKEDLSRSSLW